MNRKRWLFAAALLPICLLSAQQQRPQRVPQQASHDALQGPVSTINDLAGHIQSLDDARKLVDLVAAELSHELPPRWTTRSIRNRIARAEYESAYDPGALIPEHHVADAWNDYLQKIGAPQEVYVTATEIHTLRDISYVTSQHIWARGDENIWLVPNIYAVGQNGKVANGCRALEALNILWRLANYPQTLEGTRELIKTDQSVIGIENGQLVIGRAMPPNLVQQAALKYMHVHGVHALDSAMEGLLHDLFAS
jgi:hypothetical protein